jgi:O-antigen/teichoic acid export membrane protein
MSTSTVRSALYFASSRYLLLGVSVIRNLVVARLLGPEGYGYWVLMMLILVYGDQLHLGLRHAGDKEIPYWIGRGERGESERCADAIFGGTLVLSLAAFVSLAAYALFLSWPTPALSRAVVVTGLILIADQVTRFYLMILRTRREFVVSSNVEAASEGIKTLAVCALAVSFNLLGSISGLLLASGATAIYLHATVRDGIVPKLDLRALKRIAPVATSLFLGTMLYIVIINLDRLLGAIVLTKSELGVFGVGSLVAQVPVSAAQALKDVLYPTLSERYGHRHRLEDVVPVYTKGLQVLAYYLPFTVGLVFVAGDLLIRWLLPGYEGAIPVAAMLSNGVYFLGLGALPAGMLMATGRSGQYVAAQATAATVTIGAYMALNSTFDRLPSLAIGAAFGFLVYGVALITLAGEGRGWSVLSTLRISLPSLYSMFLVFFVAARIPIAGRDHLSAAALTIGRVVLYSLLYLPVLAIGERKIGLLEYVRNRRTHGSVVNMTIERALNTVSDGPPPPARSEHSGQNE